MNTIQQLSEALTKKEISAEDLVAQSEKLVNQYDQTTHAFLSTAFDSARVEARASDERRKQQTTRGALDGIPYAVKDNILVEGLPATAASKMLESYRAVEDATVVSKLRQQGAMVVGKTNLDEFAHGASTEYSAFGPAHNPWDLNRVPGGSSGGSAVAVAAGYVPFALGTDTGGSVRHPAAFCGLVGLKPTYGRASRYGLIAMTSSTDVPGILARTVADVSVVLEAIAGEDPRDMNSLPAPVLNYKTYLQNDTLKGVRIGLPKEYFIAGLNSDVRAAVMAAVEQLQTAGAEICEVSLPHTENAVPAYYIVTPAEVSTNLARYDSMRYGERPKGSLWEVYETARGQGFGAEARRRIMVGTHALSAGYHDAYYLQAAKVRTKIREDFSRVFEQVDVLLTPTTPDVAFKSGEKSADPVAMYLEDIFLTAPSLAGLPALSAPCGFAPRDGKQLPIGLQLIGKHLDEAAILAVGAVYQRLTDWHTKTPSVYGSAVSVE